MALDNLARAWEQHPTFTDDRSNDYQDRSIAVEAAERNARNVQALKAQAECGHCGRILNMRTRAASKHVIACELEHRPYAFGRHNIAR